MKPTVGNKGRTAGECLAARAEFLARMSLAEEEEMSMG